MALLPRRMRLPISMVVGLVNLVALILPVVGLLGLGLLQSELIRQTESALLGQGAMIMAAYEDALQTGDALPADYGKTPTQQDPVLVEAKAEAARRMAAAARGEPTPSRPVLTPRLPTLSLTGTDKLPRLPDTQLADQPADLRAQRAGAQVQPLINKAHLSALAAVRVLDFNGIAVASTGAGLGHDYTSWPEVETALAGVGISVLRDREAQAEELPLETISRSTLLRVFVALPVIRNDRVVGAVVLSRTPRNLSRILYEKRWPLIVLTLGILAFMGVLVGLTSGLISRPLKVVVQQARQAAGGARHGIQPLKSPMTQEVADLSESLVAMTHALKARETTIRDFARQVSHELKTPIANISGATELLADDFEDMPPAARQRFLSNIQSNAEKMKRLVNDLLALARAEAGPTGPEAARPVAQVVNHALDQALVLNTLPVTVTGAETLKGQISMPAARLESLLLALMDNSRAHGGEGVTASLELETVDNRLVLIYRDTGPGLPDDLVDTAIRPFVTTAAGRGQTGLGLAIVKALLDGHGGRLHLQAGPGFYAKISLPLTGPIASPLTGAAK